MPTKSDITATGPVKHETGPDAPGVENQGLKPAPGVNAGTSMPAENEYHPKGGPR